MSDAAGERARSWLRGHGFPDTGMTPLLVHRLQARHQANRHLGLATVTGTLGGVLSLQFDSTLIRGAGFAVAIVSVLAVRILAMRRRRAIEREIAGMLSRRATHIVPPRARQVLGARFLSGAALMYLGAALLVLTAASPAYERGAVLTVVALIAALAVTDGIEVALIVHRPVLAEDAQSLAVDDVLRTEDARTVLTPLLPVLLSWLVLDLRWEASLPALASLALVALLFCLGWAAEHARARRPQEVLS